MNAKTINKLIAKLLDIDIDDKWQHIESMHLTKQQIGIVRDLRQIELLRDYMETL